MRRKLFVGIATFCTSIIACFILAGGSAAAESFNSNNIISDSIFNDHQTMTVGQINSFLNSFSGSCISQNNGFSAPDPTGYSPSSGFTYGGNVSAGQIIYDAAVGYGLNPQVLLATTQKEKSLVTGGGSEGCGTLAYTGAAGYGCPDSGGGYNYSGVDLYSINGNEVTSVSGTCVNTQAKAGFSQQIIHAAWLLRFDEQRAEGNVGFDVQSSNYPEQGDYFNNSDDPQSCYSGFMTPGTYQTCPGGPYVNYSGQTTIDGQSVTIADGATAALYDYTPHFSGNQSFVSIFSGWFGSTYADYSVGVLCNVQSDGSCTVPNGAPQYLVFNGAKYPIPDTVTESAWNLANQATSLSSSYLNTLATGTSLTRLFLVKGGGSTQYFADNGNSYSIASIAMLDTWNLQGVTPLTVPSDLASLLTYQGGLSYVVQEPGSQTQALVDGTDTNGNLLFRPINNPYIELAWEGDSPTVIPISQAFVTQFNVDLSSSAITSTQVSCNGNDYQVDSNQLLLESANLSAMYPGPVLSVSQQTCNNMVYNSTTLTPFIRAYNQSTVYMIDNGEKNIVSNPQILQAWGGAAGTIIVSDGYINSIPSNTTVSSYLASSGGTDYLISNGQQFAIPSDLVTAYTTSGTIFSASSSLISWLSNGGTATDFIRGANTPTVYLIENGTLEPIPSWQVFTLWNGGKGEAETVVTNDVLNQFTESGNWVSPYFTVGSTNYIMDNGTYYTVSGTVASAWGLSSPYSLSSDILTRFTSGGALTSYVSAGGTNYDIIGGQSYGTTNSAVLTDWGLSSPLAVSTSLVGYIPNGGALTQFARSSSSSDQRIFAVDGTNLYTLQNPSQAFSYGIGTSVVVIPSANLSNYTISNANQLVTDGTSYYVVDANNIRPFASTSVQNDFSNNSNSNFLHVSDNFLALYAHGSSVGQAIKASGPNVYAMVNGQEEYLNGQQFASSFSSTDSQVSDWLMANFTQGPNY